MLSKNDKALRNPKMMTGSRSGSLNSKYNSSKTQRHQAQILQADARVQTLQAKAKIENHSVLKGYKPLRTSNQRSPKLHQT